MVIDSQANIHNRVNDKIGWITAHSVAQPGGGLRECHLQIFDYDIIHFHTIDIRVVTSPLKISAAPIFILAIRLYDRTYPSIDKVWSMREFGILAKCGIEGIAHSQHNTSFNLFRCSAVTFVF